METSLQDSAPQAATEPLDLEALYHRHADFVWRCLRRLGVRDANLDDAVQEVFLVVHRRLGDLHAPEGVRSWLFAIAFNVARDHRRAAQRKGLAEPLPETLRDPLPDPSQALSQREDLRLLDAALDTLDDPRRAVFVLTEIEQLTAPEIASALGVNLNTVYSRLRLARADFERAVARLRRRTP
ncbi:MAG: sigma-70 family RNA polymerase sigma factor [Deltaproteobacteria bacterium]|nr:sigma-70 family RNA polymerase sigma factor [Deltaproteobacteria bacterium]